METQSYIHLYTGDGKGKTTAAFGLALRALCSGKKIFVAQFVKNMKYQETQIENYFDNITIKQYGRGCFIHESPDKEDILMAENGLRESSISLCSGEYDMVVLDELTIALYFNLLSIHNVISVIRQRANHTEVVITGRYAPYELIEISDLVTEMKEIKHYFQQGVLSRKGFDF